MIMIPISALNLTGILELIGLNKLQWSILDIWAISHQNSGLDMLSLEDKTKVQFGYRLEWNELLEISRNIDQVNECTIVGFNTSKHMPSRDLSLRQLREICDIVIESVDSTKWEISIRDDDLRQKLAKHIS